MTTVVLECLHVADNAETLTATPIRKNIKLPCPVDAATMRVIEIRDEMPVREVTP